MDKLPISTTNELEEVTRGGVRAVKKVFEERMRFLCGNYVFTLVPENDSTKERDTMDIYASLGEGYQKKGWEVEREVDGNLLSPLLISREEFLPTSSCNDLKQERVVIMVDVDASLYPTVVVNLWRQIY